MAGIAKTKPSSKKTAASPGGPSVAVKVALWTGILSLLASGYGLFKSVVYDRRLSEFEIAQRGIDLAVAQDAILTFELGTPSISELGSKGATPAAKKNSNSPKDLLVTVPLTVKNISKLPISVDFNEQWTFRGDMLTIDTAHPAERINGANDSYPIAWTRAQCIIGIADDTWVDVAEPGLLVAKAKADQLRASGANFWKEKNSALNGNFSSFPGCAKYQPSKLEEVPSPDKKYEFKDLATARQCGVLQRLLGKTPYFDSSKVGGLCTPLQGGFFTGPIRAGEEKSLDIRYLVRGDSKPWFSHLVRIHYRQDREEEQEVFCLPARWNSEGHSKDASAWRSWMFCTPLNLQILSKQKNPFYAHRFQDLRQTIFLGKAVPQSALEKANASGAMKAVKK